MPIIVRNCIGKILFVVSWCRFRLQLLYAVYRLVVSRRAWSTYDICYISRSRSTSFQWSNSIESAELSWSFDVSQLQRCAYPSVFEFASVRRFWLKIRVSPHRQQKRNTRSAVSQRPHWRIMAFSLLCRFAPWLFSPPGLFALWLVRPLADSTPVPGWFAPTPRWIYRWFIIEACVSI